MIFSILHMLHQRAIFDVAYPTDCQLSAIHDYSYRFLDYPTIDETVEKHEY
jgi:dihydroneopterin aldolase